MAATTQNARDKKEHYWREQISGWETSGLKEQELCRTNGQGLATCGYWHRKFKKKGSPSIRFYPLTVPAETRGVSLVQSNSALRLVIGDHRFTIEIDGQFSSSALQRLVIALEEL